jgi:hypothetical protein
LIFSEILTKLVTASGVVRARKRAREAGVNLAVTGCVARVFVGGTGIDAGIRARRAISGI